MNKLSYIESFTTIDQCVDYLQRIGCNWTYEKENILKAKGSFKYKETIVFYDPYELLEVQS